MNHIYKYTKLQTLIGLNEEEFLEKVKQFCLGFPTPFQNKPAPMPCPRGEGRCAPQARVVPCDGGTARRTLPPSELEQVDEVLGGHGHEAAAGVGGGAGVPRVLRDEAEGSVTTEHPGPGAVWRTQTCVPRTDSHGDLSAEAGGPS